MDLGIISMRYANALLLFATENGEEEQVYTETSTLAESYLEVPALQQAMINPVLTDAQKQNILLTAACGTSEPSKSLSRFVLLVLKKMRADIMLFVAHSYGTLYRKKNHIIKGELTLPTALKPEIIQRLKEMVEGKSKCRVDFKVKEDPAIGGGFILQYDTYRLDASVRSQLAKFKRELH